MGTIGVLLMTQPARVTIGHFWDLFAVYAESRAVPFLAQFFFMLKMSRRLINYEHMVIVETHDLRHPLPEFSKIMILS
jgi:hypothetical protein